MSTARTAIRRRRMARFDDRYKYKHRDATAQARRLAQRIATERRIQQGGKK